MARQWLPDKCARPHCNGSLYVDEDIFGVIESVCSLCSRRVVLRYPMRWPDLEWVPAAWLKAG